MKVRSPKHTCWWCDVQYSPRPWLIFSHSGYLSVYQMPTEMYYLSLLFSMHDKHVITLVGVGRLFVLIHSERFVRPWRLYEYTAKWISGCFWTKQVYTVTLNVSLVFIIIQKGSNITVWMMKEVNQLYLKIGVYYSKVYWAHGRPWTWTRFEYKG